MACRRRGEQRRQGKCEQDDWLVLLDPASLKAGRFNTVIRSSDSRISRKALMGTCVNTWCVRLAGQSISNRVTDVAAPIPICCVRVVAPNDPPLVTSR